MNFLSRISGAGALLSASTAILFVWAVPYLSSIRFVLVPIAFPLETYETPIRHSRRPWEGEWLCSTSTKTVCRTSFSSTAQTLNHSRRSDPKDKNRLLRKDGNGVFTDVTDKAGVAGTVYDIGVAVSDYDNDGYPDLFVASLHRNKLYHNNGDGTFTDVTKNAGTPRPIRMLGSFSSVPPEAPTCCAGFASGFRS
jgi:enediyne biosynthesis protein E4